MKDFDNNKDILVSEQGTNLEAVDLIGKSNFEVIRVWDAKKGSLYLAQVTFDGNNTFLLFKPVGDGQFEQASFKNILESELGD